MPAKKKLSPKARTLLVAEENKGLKITAESTLKSEETITSLNGTKRNGCYMSKPDGSFYIMTTERRSRKTLVMKWRQL